MLKKNLILLIFFLGSTLYAIIPEIENIDIYSDKVGSFLDFDLDYYQRKASLEYRIGNYEDAAKIFLFCARHNIYDIVSIYNLSCCYGLLGKDTLAARFLERAVRAGFNDLELINQDPDFDLVKESEVFNLSLNRVNYMIKRDRDLEGNILFIDAVKIFKCRIQLPQNYSESKEYTLMIGLHGFSSNADDFIKLWDNFNNPNFIYVALTAPYQFLSRDILCYSWNLMITDNHPLIDVSTEFSENYIIDAIENIKRNFNISKVCLFGFSQGGFLAYSTAIKNPDLIDGIICVGATLDSGWIGEEYLKGGNSVKIFISHGTEDRSVSIEEAIKSKEILEHYGYEVDFFEYSGGHRIQTQEGFDKMVDWIRNTI